MVEAEVDGKLSFSGLSCDDIVRYVITVLLLGMFVVTTFRP
jgi:hypothetical protein